jgi:hypothetical protein
LKPSDKLSTLLKENKGFLKTLDAVAAGISRTVLGDFVRRNNLKRVAHGLYMSQDAWVDGLFVIQVCYPEAVFSHETALYLLHLADREPYPFSVTIKAGTNSVGLLRQGVRVYKVKQELFHEGIVLKESPTGHLVRTYNAERTICDLFRSRSRIEIQDLQTAVKEYIRLPEKNIPQLLRYARAFSIEKQVQQYLEALL